jgi:hypothetical protein
LPSLFASPAVILFLDLFGTMAFAVTVAFKAIEHISDIVGIIILSTITGVAGGIIREMILGRIPPKALVNPLYIILTVTVAIIIFFLHPSLKKVLEFIAEIRNDLVVDVCKKFSNNLSEKREDDLPTHYILLTLHRAELVDDPEMLKKLPAFLSQIKYEIIFPAHPRMQ